MLFCKEEFTHMLKFLLYFTWTGSSFDGLPTASYFGGSNEGTLIIIINTL